MLTVTVPTQGNLDAIQPLPRGIRAIVWDITTDLPPEEAERVEMVLIPHYFFSRRGWQRVAALPNLRYIQLPSAGYNHAEPYRPAQVALLNGSGIHDDETAELAIGLALSSLRGMDDALRRQDAGVWEFPMTSSLVDRTCLVVGFGRIGREIAARLLPFKTRVEGVAHSSRVETVGGVEVPVHAVSELPELLPRFDVVFVIMPLTDETEHLFDAEMFARMHDGALFVNVARGAIVDTDALLAELAAGRLRAALDVTDPEPLPADHPLWHAPGCIITPHTGGNTTATEPRTEALMRRQLAHLAAGEALENLVVPADAL